MLFQTENNSGLLMVSTKTDQDGGGGHMLRLTVKVAIW